MSRALLAQDDFSCLGLAAGQDADSQPLELYDGCNHGFPSVERAESGDSLKSESCCEADELYRPVNFIPDEVYELIRNWELAYQKQQESNQAIDSMDTDTAFSDSRSSESIVEPMRCMSVLQPPKRFYRTFWRSVTRRIVQREKENAFSRAAMARSDASHDGSSPSSAAH